MQQVHISIDDVVESLRQAATSPKGVNSSRMFRLLNCLHRLTGLKVTLYVFLRDGKGFSLDQVPSVFARYPWLRFAFHGVMPTNEPPTMTPDELDQAICQTHRCIERFAGADKLTDIMRMHYWQYPDEYIQVLKRYGYKTVLTRPRNDVRANEYTTNGTMTTWQTQVRIEQLSCREIIKAIKAYNQSTAEQPLVIFTHEWALSRRRVVLRFVMTVILLRLKKFTFI